MNMDKVISILGCMESLISEIKNALICPTDVRITAIHREDLSYVEYWDGNQKPRILYCMDEKVSFEIIEHAIVQAINIVPPSYCGSKDIDFHTDLIEKDFSIPIQIGVDIFEMKINEVSDELLNQIRGRHDFNDYMSRVKETQVST